ncbi:conserved hypothetical protein [Ricinus communis]|uniref:Uncharacterized protein n=1 Tax=Ricinus communis TaxID=3988 RepID=B9SF40_RICCO|nr:conserved hypothetical protein [Ricinus communis]
MLAAAILLVRQKQSRPIIMSCWQKQSRPDIISFLYFIATDMRCPNYGQMVLPLAVWASYDSTDLSDDCCGECKFLLPFGGGEEDDREFLKGRVRS